jgi:hypothetical protein
MTEQAAVRLHLKVAHALHRNAKLTHSNVQEPRDLNVVILDHDPF